MKTSELLDDIATKNQVDKISIDNILQSNTESSYFLIFIMALLSLIPTPFPFPIISNIFGIILIILSTQLLFNVKTLKLPKFIREFSIKREYVVLIIEKSSSLLRRVEFFTKNRFYFYKNPVIKCIINIIIFLSSICIAIPIPLTNTIPAIGIIILTFGILNNDGLFILFGLLFSVCGIVIFVLVLIYGKVFIHKIKKLFI